MEELCKRILNVDEIDEWYDSYEEQLTSEEYDKYIINKGELYKVVSMNDIDECQSEFNITENQDGTFDYSVRYYNGGCCFSEAINYAFRDFESK